MSKVSDRDLEKALYGLAKIIKRYGDAYWPIFETLEFELDQRKERSTRLARYSGQIQVSGIREWR